MRRFIVFLVIFNLTFISYAQQNEEVKTEEKTFEIVENVPIYKGCENLNSNALKKKCMTKKIINLVSREFNTEITDYLDIEEGNQRILTTFKINAEGKVVDVHARGPHKILEEEAIRVISLIPQMTPGYQRGEPVVIPYSIPINIYVEGNTKLTFPIYRGCDKSLTYTEAKRCSSEKIKDFIKLSFDLDIADRALPLEKTTQFELTFTVNKKGRVENVTAKSNHKAIAIEAIRTAKRLPKFKEAGTRNGKPIDTPMSITMKIYF